jgi:long-chain fatty acid transport protein
LAPGPAAAGGLYLYEIGTRDAGFASAGWAARADDVSTLATNPAGLARLKSRQFMVGAQPLYADVKFDPDGNTTVDGKDGDAADWIPSAGLFYGRPINERWAYGVGVYGNFGSALDYGTDWVGRYYVDQVTLQAIVFQPTVSYRLNDEWSVGAGLAAVYGIYEQQARVRNLEPGAGDGRLKIDDEDLVFTGNFGVLWEPSAETRFGLQYLMSADLEFNDRPSLTGIGPLLEAIIDRQGLAGGKLGLDFTYPNAVRLSAYHDLNARWSVMGNVGWDEWSEFGKVDVLVSAEDQENLVFDRNYDDTWHAAVGAEYRASDRWRFSGGVAYDSSMMDDDERTPDLPTGEAWRFGFGAEYTTASGLRIAGTYALIWNGDLDMDVNRGPLAGRVSGTYNDTAIHALGFIVTWSDL